MRRTAFIVFVLGVSPAFAQTRLEEARQAWAAAKATHNRYVIDAVRAQLLKDNPAFRDWLEPTLDPAASSLAEVPVASPTEAIKGSPTQGVPPRLTGEIQVGMENDTGNTKNTSINGKASIAYEATKWLYVAHLSAAYGESGGKENSANYRAMGQANYKLQPDLRWMTTVFWNSNRFTGFSGRFDEVTGISKDSMVAKNVKLTSELAVGVQQVNLTNGTNSNEAILWTRANLLWPFAKNWTFSEDLRNSWGTNYDFLWSVTSLTTPLNARWKVRLSYEADYVNKPPLDRESLDTISLVSLVYGFH